ncbi:MAG: GyrI-like domain-containing protein, partial [Ilumatobacter sp.]
GQRCGVGFPGHGSARYPAPVTTDDEPVEAYVTIDQPVTIPDDVAEVGVVLTIIPAERCAVATHVGGYDTVGDTYRQLGAWVAHHAVSADRPIREHYVVSVDPATGELLPDEQLRTEIAWPIRDD